MEREQMMKAIRKRLNAIEPNINAYLFGSRARGDARDDEDADKRSDRDVLILLDKSRVMLEDYDNSNMSMLTLSNEDKTASNTVSSLAKEAIDG